MSKASTTSSKSKSLPSFQSSHQWNEHRNDKSSFKSGPWSKEDDDVLKKTFSEYCSLKNLAESDEVKLSLLTKVKGTPYHDFYSFLATPFHDRTIRSVMRRAKRLFHPGNNNGKFTEEEKETLVSLVARYGPKWDVIGAEMNRLPQTLSSLYTRLKTTNVKNVLLSDNTSKITVENVEPRVGPWSDKEEAKLIKYVRKYGVKKSNSDDSDASHEEIDGDEDTSAEKVLPGNYISIPWSRISLKFHGKRSATQCRNKWVLHGFGERAETETTE
jgi:Myb-like DNA-binding domain